MKVGKCYLLLLLALNLNFGCKESSENKRSIQNSTVDFPVKTDKSYIGIPSEYNFGKINKKNESIIEFKLEVNNLGESPLVIMKVDVSCGCMEVKFTQHPIKKGEKGTLNVRVNAANQNGIFNKSIIVKSNAQNDLVIVRVKGYIL